MLEENWSSLNEIERADIEMVLVNDFPIEKLEIKRQWIQNISYVEISNRQNGGIHFSRVQGLSRASGEYILFLDQDDKISPVYMREQMAALKDADAIICNGKNRNSLIYRNSGELERAVDKEEYRRGDNRIISPGQVLLRRSAIPEEWVSNILLKNGADDYFLWMLMLCKNKKMSVHNKVLYWHFISDINTSKNTDEMDNSVFEMLSKMRDFDFLTSDEEKKIRQIRNGAKSSEILSDEKYRKEKCYRQILDMWMTLKDRGVTVAAFFNNMGIKKVAIYGGGILGKHLYYELNGTDIKVTCFLDRNRKADVSGIKTIIPGEPLEDVDVIVITPIMEYEKIRDTLRGQYHVDMISIETVIYNADCELMME